MIRCKMDGVSFLTEFSLDPFSIDQWLPHYEYKMVLAGQHTFKTIWDYNLPYVKILPLEETTKTLHKKFS